VGEMCGEDITLAAIAIAVAKKLAREKSLFL